MIQFREGNRQQNQEASKSVNKRDRFRKEIRKSNLNTQFMQIRNRLTESVSIEDLRQFLQSLDNKFQKQAFEGVLAILESNCGSAGFNLKIAQNQLQSLLVNVVLKNQHDLSFTQSNQVISAFNFLTYYSIDSTLELLKENSYIDYLGRVMVNLDMGETENIKYFCSILGLFMNTTSALSFEFNIYLAESDICMIINKQLAKTISYCKMKNAQYSENVFEARQKCLRFYYNVVQVSNSQKPAHDIFASLIASVLRDQQNLLHHKFRTFLLMSVAMKKHEQFWSALMNDLACIEFSICITQAMDQIQQRCFSRNFLQSRQTQLTDEQNDNFYALACFLNQLFYEGNDYEVTWSRMVQNVLNGYMLAQFLIQNHQKQKKEYVTEAIKLFLHLSRTYEVTGAQLIIVRQADDPLELLKIFTNLTIVKSHKTGPYCLQIMTNLLRKDEKFLPSLMEFRVLDCLNQIFENITSCSRRLVENAIKLATELIVSEKKLKKQRSLFQIMETRSIVKHINLLNDSQDRDIYTVAEIFLAEVEGEVKSTI